MVLKAVVDFCVLSHAHFLLRFFVQNKKAGECPDTSFEVSGHSPAFRSKYIIDGFGVPFICGKNAIHMPSENASLMMPECHYPAGIRIQIKKSDIEFGKM